MFEEADAENVRSVTFLNVCKKADLISLPAKSLIFVSLCGHMYKNKE